MKTEIPKPNLAALKKLAEKPGALTESELAASCAEAEVIPRVFESRAKEIEGVSAEGNPQSTIFSTIVTPKKIKAMDLADSRRHLLPSDDFSGDDL